MPTIEISAPRPQHVEVFIHPGRLRQLVDGDDHDRRVILVRHVGADGETIKEYQGYEARFELCHLTVSPERRYSPHAYVTAHWVALDVP